jgi:hypothetical protein
MPIIRLTPGVGIIISKHHGATGKHFLQIKLSNPTLVPRRIQLAANITRDVVFPMDGFIISFDQLVWIISNVCVQSMERQPSFYVCNGVNLSMTVFTHLQPRSALIEMPWDGFILAHESNNFGPFKKPAYYMDNNAYQELYTLFPLIGMLYTALDMCPDMIVDDNAARFVWKNYQIEFFGAAAPARIEITDTAQKITLALSPRLCQQLLKTENPQIDHVIHLSDDYKNILNTYIGVFEDGLPRQDAIVLTPRDFDIAKALVNILRIGF